MGGAAGCFLSRMAFSTSPGLEMCDKSILVLISSGAACELRASFADPWPSPGPRKRKRTFSASCSSSELECVFFSLTPTSSSTSRIALLLTSSSLAKSLIRILLIRLFVPPNCLAKSSYQPRGKFLVASGQWPVHIRSSVLIPENLSLPTIPSLP